MHFAYEHGAVIQIRFDRAPLNLGKKKPTFHCYNITDSQETESREISLSHNNPCFQCNTAITNFLIFHTCEIRFDNVIGQSAVPMYSYAKIPK